MRSTPFYLVLLIPISVFIGYILGGIYAFITPIFVFGIIPILDAIIGLDDSNLSQQEVEKLRNKFSFKIITWICAFAQVFTVLLALYIVSLENMRILELIGFTISLGISSGVMGINVSHELQHRVNNKFEPFLARMMLLTTLYMHWAIEHVTGHHRYVATPEDPATAKKDQSFYNFWFQTVFGGIKSAWNFEKIRLKRKNDNQYGLRNRIIQYLILEIIFMIFILFIFGYLALIVFFVQAILAITDLEIINYIEHYGLERKKLSNGKYEKVNPTHSWNSSNKLTNWFLFNLQRHSDHHFRPDKRYQMLNHYDESSQLPSGYATMLLLALIPPLWKKKINPLIKS